MIDYADHVLAAMLDAVIVTDPRGSIVAVNRATCRLLGYAQDDLINEPMLRVFADEDSALHTLQLKAIGLGGELRREEAELLAKDGTAIAVSVTASPLRDSDERFCGVVLVARDLRETNRLVRKLAEQAAVLTREVDRRKQVEEALKRANDRLEAELEKARSQLIHAERLATLGTLAGGVGHELNNIAMVYSASLYSLRAFGRQDALITEVLEDLERVGEHIAAHGKRLLALARPGPDHVEPIDLRQVITATLAMLRGAGKTKHIDVSTQLPDTPLMVTVNRTRVEQILFNLVANAVDALAGVRGRKRTICVVVEPSGERVICRVEDTGCGIAADKLPRLFDAFYTTKAPEHGTGLGLSVVKQIVESYSGTLSVTSVEGEGSAFQFDLPAARGESAASIAIESI